jgi:hypothetical protein
MSKSVPNGFEFKGLTLLKNGGISITHTDMEVEDSITNTNNRSLQSTKDPHPDLVNKVKDLSKFVAKIHNMVSFQSLKKAPATAKLDEAVKTMQSTFDKLAVEVMNHIDVTGFSLSGSEGNLGVVIKAVNRYNKEAIALNSSRINLEGTKHGFEVELSECVDSIIEEVQMYLFEGKCAIVEQTEMEFDENDTKKAV